MSNLDDLKKILAELRKTPYDNKKIEKAEEFIAAAISDADDYEKKIDELEEEIDELEDAADEHDNSLASDFVGLDTIEWRLQEGNLAMQQEVENFIEYLKKKNGVTP